jgi:iron complex outermembrane receptor protein
LPFGTPTTSEALQEGYKTPKNDWGVFGQVSYDLAKNLQLQVGGRYSDASMSMTDHTIVTYNGVVLVNHPITDEREHDSRLTGKVNLNYTLPDRGLLYAFVATGYKSGGINPIAALGLPAGSPAPLFKPEDVTDYEAGWKDNFFDGHLRTQLDGYYYDYRNFQVLEFDPSSALAEVLNAGGRSRIEGVEAQGQGVFGDLSIDFGVSYLSSRLGTFMAIDSRNPTLGVQNLTGHQLPNAAPWSGNLGIQYVFHLMGEDTLMPRVDYGGISGRWSTAYETPVVDRLSAQNLVNAQLTWAHRGWNLTAYATNLTDLHYVSSLSLGDLANAGPPRQYGIRISTTF